MHEKELISNWGEQKSSHNYRLLQSPCAAEFEHIGRLGQLSSYAKVGFAAEPADTLSLSFDVVWPTDFDDTYKLRIQNTIAEAVADTLLIRNEGTICRGLRLKLVAFGWSAVGGSEMATYRATMKAMEQLREKAKWVDVLGKNRAYV